MHSQSSYSCDNFFVLTFYSNSECLVKCNTLNSQTHGKKYLTVKREQLKKSKYVCKLDNFKEHKSKFWFHPDACLMVQNIFF